MLPPHLFHSRLHAAPDTSGAGPSSPSPPIDDHRQRPAGVIPRRLQTWAVITVAILMLLIMFTTRPTPPGSGVNEMGTGDPTLDRQDQQRAIQTAIEQYRRQVDEHQRLLAQRQRSGSDLAKRSDGGADERPVVSPRDPLADERRRREYESLFASSVAHTVRGTTGNTAARSQFLTPTNPPDGADAAATGGFDPNIAAAVALALRQQQVDQSSATPAQSALPERRPTAPSSGTPAAQAAAGSAPPETAPTTPERTPPLRHNAPTQTLLEGTVIETVLTNRLDGGAAGPVNCMVTTPVYSHDTRTLLIPAGTRVLGRTRPVSNLGQERLAAVLHRLIFPDGSSLLLDDFQGLDQIGATGLTGRVDHHYWSLFGAAAVVGLIQGLSLYTSAAAVPGDSTVIITGSGASAADAAGRVMDRFLNRLPSITIREGTRVKLLLTKDVELSPYDGSTLNNAAAR
ncbi:MAG: hypothetical protein GEU99_23435 [Luteitalea sp.]|nr:hypothetical protein [Luteitalea sp.]